MTALINEWAGVVGSYSMYPGHAPADLHRAARRKDFAKHIDIETGYVADKSESLIAVVRDWDKLLNSGTV